MALSNINLLSEEAYYALLYEMLKLRENPWLFYGTGYQRIHNGGGDGNPTFGYGFNIAAFDADVVQDAILYAYSNNLSSQQAAGLELVLDWKTSSPVSIDGATRTLSNADVINLANAGLNGTGSAIGSSAQRAAVQSLYLNDAQATRLLDITVKGVLNLIHIEGSGYGFESGLDYRLAEEGILPYSTERAALLSVYYNAPVLIGPGVQHEVDTDNRAGLWYEVRYNHNHFDHTGLQNRRAEEADLLGLVSVAAKSDPQAHAEEYAESLSILFNGVDRIGRLIYPRILERDEKDPFPQSIAPELEVLNTEYGRGAAGPGIWPDIEHVQFDAFNVSVAVDASDASAKGVPGGKSYVDTVNLILAQGGDDIVRGYGGADYLYGGEGADTLIGDAGLAGVIGAADFMHGGPGVDTADYSGETGANVAAAIVAYAGATPGGESILRVSDASGAEDKLVSIERLVLSSGDNFVDLRGADDGFRVAALAGNDTVIGGSGDDNIFGGAGADQIFAGFGDDRAEGDAGADFIRSGPGADTLIGGEGADTLGASNRSDLIRAGGGADLALGSNGNDRLFGDADADTLVGGNGRDTLDGGDGPDRLVGGPGIDTASYVSSDAGVSVYLYGATGAGGDAQGDVLIDVENAVGSAFNDFIDGSSAGNRLFGGAGADTLFGGAGNDILLGQAGDDSLAGGADGDHFIFFPNAGDDRIADFGAGDTIRLIGFGAQLDSFTDVLNAAQSSNGDLVINLGGGSSLTLTGVTAGDLTSSDFIFG